MNELVKKVLNSRGYKNEEEIDKFLNPEPYDGKKMKNMEEVVEKIKQFIDKRITIFGDYDCDGINSSAILYKSLKSLGNTPRIYIPERSEGYGLSKSAIDKIHSDLIITVDCGISNHDEIQYAKNKGIEVIVTDHHEGKEPPCLYVNPKVGEEYPFKDLAGAGVIWKVCQQLLDQSLDSLIDYVTVATIGDVMPLVDENRWIAQKGIQKLNNYPSPPYKKIINRKKIKTVSAGHIGFIIAPIINAPGRMGNAKKAMEYVKHDYNLDTRAKADLKRVIEYNEQRKALVDRIKDSLQVDDSNNIIIVKEQIARGIVGLVAGDLKEEYNKPAIVIDSDTYKGSCRSVKPLNMYNSLKSVNECLEYFGGHKLAAGFKLKYDKFDEFREKMYKLTEDVEYESVSYDIEGNPYALNVDKVQEFDILEPFGVGNPKPRMLISDITAYNIKVLKEKHISFKAHGIRCIAFNMADKKDTINNNIIDIIAKPEINVWRGRKSVQFVVEKIIEGEK